MTAFCAVSNTVSEPTHPHGHTATVTHTEHAMSKHSSRTGLVGYSGACVAATTMCCVPCAARSSVCWGSFNGFTCIGWCKASDQSSHATVQRVHTSSWECSCYVIVATSADGTAFRAACRARRSSAFCAVLASKRCCNPDCTCFTVSCCRCAIKTMSRSSVCGLSPFNSPPSSAPVTPAP